MDRLQLKTILAEVLVEITGEPCPPLDDGKTLQEQVQLDSIDVISMAIDLRERIGVTLEPSDVTPLTTVGELVARVQSKLAGLPAIAA